MFLPSFYVWVMETIFQNCSTFVITLQVHWISSAGFYLPNPLDARQIVSSGAVLWPHATFLFCIQPMRRRVSSLSPVGLVSYVLLYLHSDFGIFTDQGTWHASILLSSYNQFLNVDSLLTWKSPKSVSASRIINSDLRTLFFTFL